MSECVVRMEMPKGCVDCPFMNMLLCCCVNGRKYVGGSPVRPDWCPIICKLPEGHGRLVESDRVAKMIDRWIVYLDEDMIYRIKFALNRDVPTIVPAERSET